MKVQDGLSMVFKQGRWLARYRTVAGIWSAKHLPAELTEAKEGKAKIWIIAWYDRYLADAGVVPANADVKPSRRITLNDVFDRWVVYRREDPGTDPRYAKHLSKQYLLWIANDRLARLDVRTELGPLQIVQWLKSLRGAASSRLTYASTLSVMITDVILHGERWGVDPGMSHPMLANPHVVRELDALRLQKRTETVTPIFTPAELDVLLTSRNSKVRDVRRIQYLLRLATGMRDREAQGLIWDDIKALPSPHVWILRQLVSPGSAPFRWLADVRRETPHRTLKLPQAIAKPPKRNSRRALPLPPLAVEALAWWRRTGWRQFTGRAPTSQDPVFPSGLRNSHQAYGQFCTPTSGAMLLVDLQRLGIERVYTSPHNGLETEHTSRSLRHTFASRLSQMGVDDARIGDLLGHSSASVTRTHYIETLLETRADVVAKLRLPDLLMLQAHEIRNPLRSKRAPAKALPPGRSR